jgi:hypothetical protein
MAIDGESCILALPCGNMTFHLTSVKPFNVLDVKTKVNLLEPEYNNQGTKGKDIIIINTLPTIPLKYNRGYPYKYTNITIFL